MTRGVRARQLRRKDACNAKMAHDIFAVAFYMLSDYNNALSDDFLP